MLLLHVIVDLLFMSLLRMPLHVVLFLLLRLLLLHVVACCRTAVAFIVGVIVALVCGGCTCTCISTTIGLVFLWVFDYVLAL